MARELEPEKSTGLSGQMQGSFVKGAATFENGENESSKVNEIALYSVCKSAHFRFLD